MQMTARALVTAIHGMLFGGFFLLTCFGAVVLLQRSLLTRDSELTDAGRRWERVYLIATVVLGWAAVLSGAYLVYPWYRAALPPGTTDLAGYPQRLLLSDPATAGWHKLGMEWKEHVAWMAPILMTMAAWVMLRYRNSAGEHRRLRAAATAFAMAALLATGIAAGFGALINKQAPVNGGSTIQLMRGTR